MCDVCHEVDVLNVKLSVSLSFGITCLRANSLLYSFVFPHCCSIFPLAFCFFSVNKRQNAGVLFACMELLQ